MLIAGVVLNFALPGGIVIPLIAMAYGMRQREFVRQIKNPYCFKVGKVIVKVSYADNGKTFEELMENYLQTL